MVLDRPHPAASNKSYLQTSSAKEPLRQEEKGPLKQHLEQGYLEGDEHSGDELE